MSLYTGILCVMQTDLTENIDGAELITHLNNKALLLSVNNRLSEHYRKNFNQTQLEQGKSVWESPQIQPLNSWLQSQAFLLREQTADLHILEPVQEHMLWTDIINRDNPAGLMMQPGAIARRVMQAWQLCRQWQIPAQALQGFASAEAESLLRWSSSFEKTCKSNNWLPATLLIEKLSQAISAGRVNLPATIIFAGFQDPNKLHQLFWQSLQNTGCRLLKLHEQNINHNTQIVPCTDFSDEINSAAHWARDLLIAGHKRIALVIPGLTENRGQVAQCLQDVLHPERAGSLPPYSHNNLFNLSLGIPLHDFTLVSDALAVLELLQHEFSLQQLERVLHAVYLSSDSNNLPLSTAHTALALRRFGRKTWTLPALLRHLQHSHAEQTSSVAEKLERLVALAGSFRQQHTASQWSEHFAACWAIMGWPGQRTLNSDEYQQSQRLLKLLSEFRRLSLVQNGFSVSQAISHLKQLCRDTIFQVQSEDAPVQVYGLLEAADQRFEHLWLANLDDRVLPAATSPNPFIPVSVQRQYNVPHASAERELLYAEQLLKQFINDSSNTVLSYAVKEQDTQLRPTPLIDALQQQGYPMNHSDMLSTAHPPAEQTPPAAAPLETLADSQMPALQLNEAVRGGSGVLTAQAQCPFKAAAGYRLNAREPDAGQEGVSAMDRGNQIHEIMQKLWGRLETLENLKAMDAEQLHTMLEDSIAETLAGYVLKRPDLYQEHFLKLEKACLKTLTADWLQHEKQRSGNFSIAAMEEAADISVGGIMLHIKADRIDQLDSGERIILDYKTGTSASSKSWLEENITEPQLPLYSLIENDSLAGLALAKINEKNCQFSGITRHQSLLPDIKPGKVPEFLQQLIADNADANPDPDEQHWQSIRQHWKKQLERLGSSFRTGEAGINPDNCQYCPYPGLCRKHESEKTGRTQDFS